jgi:hypothetical protein
MSDDWVIYEVYNGTRCRKFTPSEYSKEVNIRRKKGYSWFQTVKVSAEDAKKLGTNPKLGDALKYEIQEEEE